MPLHRSKLILPLTLGAFAIAAHAEPFPMPPKPPNIVIILTDDLGYNDLGAYSSENGTHPPPYNPGSYQPLPGPNQASGLTPRIDSLASQGIKMTSFYASASQCSPARASLLTGCYGFRVGIPDVLQPYSKNPGVAKGFHADELTLPELLKARGYATGAIGKWHLGDLIQYLPTRHGFDSWFGIPYSHDMWPQNSNFGPWPDLPLFEDEAPVNYTTASGGIITSPISTTSEQQYLLEAITEKALSFIETHQSEPFFLYFAPHAPHVPCWPHPDFINGSGVSYYYDVVMELDFRVGQILDKLEALGLTNDTLIIFTSDNGPWLLRPNPNHLEQSTGSAYPLWGSKSTSWEGGHRIPFLARYPGHIPAGSVSDAIGEHTDLLPTIINLVGGEVPTERTLDGGDLWPVLSGQPGAVSPDDTTYYFKSNTLYGVRQGDWKYWSNSGNGANAGDFFNLVNDVQEQVNVTSQPNQENALASLRSTFWSEVNANKRPAGAASTQGLVLSATRLSVNEGDTATFRVQLAANPGGALTVAVVHRSGDSDLAVSGGSNLLFTSANWNSPQIVTIAAFEDADMVPGTGVIQLSAAGVPSRQVYATEVDNDAVPGVEPGLIWPKVAYATLPDAAHGLIADGTATINSIPNPTGTTYTWTQVSGSPAIFDSPFAKTTGVTFPAVGDYVLRLTTGYPSAVSLSTDFQVRVDPAGATPPSGSGPVETERVPYPLEPPGAGSFGSGFTNYRAIVNWYERYGEANNADINNTASGREVLQDEANASVPAATEGAYWVNLAPDSTYTNPSIYQSLGTWSTGDDTSYEVSFDLGDRDGSTFGNLTVQLIYTDSGFTPNDGTSLTTAAGFSVADSTATYTDSHFSGSGNRTLTGLTDTLILSGVTNGQQVWIRVTASGNGTQSLIDNLRATSEEPATLNVAPVINPGASQATAYSVNAIPLGGAVTDDGLSGGSVTTEWTQANGPGTATFVDPASPASSVSFDYPGSYTLRLIADDGQIRAFRETIATLAPLTFAEWAAAESLPAGQNGRADNPDGDPWSNQLEFAFGLDPMTANKEGRPWTYTVIDTASPQTISFLVPRNRRPSIQLLKSSDLNDWTASGILPSIIPVDRDWSQWTFEFVPEPEWKRIFLRLLID